MSWSPRRRSSRTPRPSPHHPVHARRWLGSRQRRNPRSARPRTGRRGERGGRVRRVRPVARGPVPGRDRAGLRDRSLDHAAGLRRGPRPVAAGRRGRLGRRQHDRRAGHPRPAYARKLTEAGVRTTCVRPAQRHDDHRGPAAVRGVRGAGLGQVAVAGRPGQPESLDRGQGRHRGTPTADRCCSSPASGTTPSRRPSSTPPKDSSRTTRA